MTRPRTPLRLRILAGAAASALLAGGAYAQDKNADAPTTITANDATRDADGRIELTGSAQAVNPDRTVRADKMVQDPDGRTEATGHVEAVTKTRSLRADEATFDPNADVISANGHIHIYEPDGTIEYADTLTFTKSLETGVATNFSARLPEKTKGGETSDNGAPGGPGSATVSAANIIRRDEDHTELNRVIFTACALCDANGNDKTPTWAINADEAVRDTQNGVINFQNAWIRFEGQPVIPLPFFSIADPTVDQKSGLLAPDFQHTERRGYTYDQPYLWAISPFQDMVITPQINTGVNPFVTVDWRRRFYSGLLEVQSGYTYDRDFNTGGLKFGPDHSKDYVFADGKFDVAPQWVWGFTAEAAQDRRLFDQYSLNYTPEDHGLFDADDRRLISQLYTVHQTDQAYLSMAVLGFESLRPLPGAPNAFGLRPLEDDTTLPFVGPLVEFRYEPDTTVAGGRLRLTASGVVLNRNASPDILGDPGIDSTRATAEGNWQRTFTLTDGVRIEPFADARADYYETGDLTATDTATHDNSRAIATAGTNISWPFVRVDGPMTTTIEPIVQIAISPDAKPNPQIPDIDSTTIQFDGANLFDFDKSPGFDLYDSGQRLSAGVRSTFDWGDGHSAHLLVGQTFRTKPDPLLPARTGLAGTSSDWVADVDATPITGLSLFADTRFSQSDLAEIETGVDANVGNTSGYLRYMRTDADATGAPAEDVEGAVQVFVTKDWGVLANATRDLEQQQWRRRSIGAVYRDDCLRFELLYQRDNNPLLGTKDSSSVVFRLTLATLGDTGYANYGNGRSGVH